MGESRVSCIYKDFFDVVLKFNELYGEKNESKESRKKHRKLKTISSIERSLGLNKNTYKSSPKWLIKKHTPLRIYEMLIESGHIPKTKDDQAVVVERLHDRILVDERINLLAGKEELEFERFFHIAKFFRREGMFEEYLISFISFVGKPDKYIEIYDDFENEYEYFSSKIEPYRIPSYIKVITKHKAKITVRQVGRERAVTELHKKLKNNDRVVVVNGIGGLGKTELCKKYFRKYYGYYDKIGWLTYSSSLKESLVNNISSDVVSFNENEDLEERFDKVNQYLKNINTNTLLVIDNIDSDIITDKDLDILTEYNFKILASSRIRFDEYEAYQLPYLSTSDCKKIFYNYYKGRRNGAVLEDIIELAGRHTLTIELLGKTANEIDIELPVLYRNLKKRGFNLNEVIDKYNSIELESVDSEWDKKKEKRKLFDHILKIFDLGSFEKSIEKGDHNEEVYLMTNMSILPPLHMIRRRDLADLVDIKNQSSIMSLIHRGWLNEEKNKVSMHPLIQEAINYKFSPTYEKCKSLTHSITDLLKFNSNDDPTRLAEYAIIGQSIVDKIATHNECFIRLYCNIAANQHNMSLIDNAIVNEKIALKMKKKNSEENIQSIAESYSNISLYLIKKKDYIKAKEYQKKALDIRESQYDTSPMKLAQSYDNYAIILKNLGELEKALKYKQKDLKITLEHCEPYSQELSSTYNGLALIYREMGNWDEAMKIHDKDLAVVQHRKFKNLPSKATTYNNVAMAYYRMRDIQKAYSYQREAIKLRESELDKTKHMDVAESYNNYAIILMAKHQSNPSKELFDKALRYFHDALKIRIRNYKNGMHLDIASSYKNISLMNSIKGDKKKALKYKVKQVKVLEKMLSSKYLEISKYREQLYNGYVELVDMYKNLKMLDDVKRIEAKMEMLL